MFRLTNKLRQSFAKSRENPFKKLHTKLEEAGSGLSYYSLPKLGDSRLCKDSSLCRKTAL